MPAMTGRSERESISQAATAVSQCLALCPPPKMLGSPVVPRTGDQPPRVAGVWAADDDLSGIQWENKRMLGRS